MGLEQPLEIGDKIRIEEEELEIAGLLKYDVFSGDGLTNGKINAYHFRGNLCPPDRGERLFTRYGTTDRQCR